MLVCVPLRSCCGICVRISQHILIYIHTNTCTCYRPYNQTPCVNALAHIHVLTHRSGLIKHDYYAVAAASMELGLLFVDLGILDEAEKQLHRAKLGSIMYIQRCFFFRASKNLAINRLKQEQWNCVSLA